MANPIITLIFSGDADRLKRASDEASDSTSKVGKSFDKLKDVANVASGAIIAGAVFAAKSFTDAAASQEQALGGLDAVFKQNSGQVKAWADNAANAVGLSKTAYAELAAPIGAALKGAGMDLDDATAKTNTLITVGADLAATFGGSTSDSVGALGAALRGEFDSLEKFGIALTADGVKAELAARGQDKLTGTAAKLAEKQAILDLIMKGSADSVGQFASEADTAAGAAERQSAKFENMKAALGEKLLPALTAVTEKLTVFTEWASNNTETVLVVAAAITTLAVAWATYQAVTAAWTVISAVATAAQWAWNVAMSANPIALVIIAIAALIAAFVLLWNNNEGFRNFVIGMWDTVKNAVGGAINWIGDKISTLIGWFVDAKNRAGSIFSGIADGISGAFRGAFNFVSDAWNNTIGRLNFTVPTWVPVLGGNNFAAPRLPRFHVGGVVPGNQGAEMLAVLQAGERVTPSGAPSSDAMTMRFTGNTSDALATVIMQLIRTGKIQLTTAA